jgi:hypothetical protein
MTTDLVPKLAYRLETMIYRGPGPGLPHCEDTSTTAKSLRYIFGTCEVVLLNQLARPLQATCSDLRRSSAMVESLALSWPEREDLRKMIDVAEALCLARYEAETQRQNAA